MRKIFLSKIEGLGKFSMDLPGWGQNPALSRSESTPVRRCGGPENRGNLNFGVGRVPARTQSTSTRFAGSTSAFLQMCWAKTLSGGNGGWVGLGQNPHWRIGLG